jgi:hypothetical protein
VNLPNRSMVQSNPCGTVLTPANSVKITSSTSRDGENVETSHVSSGDASERGLICLQTGRGGSAGYSRI